MIVFVVRKLAVSLITLFVVITIAFFIMRLAPGSPFESERLTDAARAAMERHYGTNLPMYVQYGNFVTGLFRGDLGRSMRRHDYSVAEILKEGVGVSFRLGVMAGGLALAAGILLGMIGAAWKNRLPDHVAMSVSIFGVCVPNFVVGPALVLLFALVLKWLDPTFPPWGDPKWHNWILPAVTLALLPMAYVARLTRSGLLDVLNKDYIRTARAKGVRPWRVYFIHALKNGITPVVSYAAPMLATIMTGSLVVERIFRVPGIGQHFVDAALNRDYPLMMGVLIIFSALVIVLNLVADVIYSVLDPQVRSA